MQHIENSHITGIIYKGIGGFYYVKTPDGSIVECKPKGLFRKQGIKPLAGDNVLLAETAGTIFIDEILERKNSFIRPPVANVDQLFIIVSTIDPAPSYLVIDKLTAVAFDNEALPIILITKTDLASATDLLEIYRKSGIEVLEIDGLTRKGIEGLAQKMRGKLSVFTGNSGVGKSTLLNALLPEAQRETGETSKKLGRGKHTTREVELFEVAGGLIADTPGFASLDLQRTNPMPKENIQLVFPEIHAQINKCRFTGCAHLTEQGCAVRESVRTGGIAQSRYESYVALYEEAKRNEKY